MRVTLAVLVAVTMAFVLGAVTGYAARGLTSSPAAATATHVATAECSAGTHPVVWYSARAWSCVEDAP